MEYTKGEWKLSPLGKEWVVGEDGFAIAKVLDGKTGKFNEANAQLIASAPRLYEALKKLVAVYEIDDVSVALMDIHDYPVCWTDALKALKITQGSQSGVE